jgi:hypothetical protein
MTIKETRFAFGENWATFSEKVTEERIDAAIEGLRRLFPNGELEGQAYPYEFADADFIGGFVTRIDLCGRLLCEHSARDG